MQGTVKGSEILMVCAHYYIILTVWLLRINWTASSLISLRTLEYPTDRSLSSCRVLEVMFSLLPQYFILVILYKKKGEKCSFFFENSKTPQNKSILQERLERQSKFHIKVKIYGTIMCYAMCQSNFIGNLAVSSAFTYHQWDPGSACSIICK